MMFELTGFASIAGLTCFATVRVFVGFGVNAAEIAANKLILR